MSKKLVIPLDGSKTSEAVLPWAEALARAGGISILLVRVVAGRRYATEYLTYEIHQQHTMPEWREGATYLGRIKHRLEGKGLEVETTVREGLTAENILDVADETDAFAIALATHGRHGFARFFLGSVAEALAHEARIPLLLIPAEAARLQPTPSFARLLVPLDGSTLAERALEYVPEISGPQAEVILVRVVTPDEDTVQSGTLLGPVIDEQSTQRAEARAREYLLSVAQQLHAGGRRAQVMTIRGDAAQEILIAGHAGTADVIVMTSHGYAGLERWRLGSVANEVIRHGDKPVLLVSARAVSARSAAQASVADLMTHNPVTLRADDSVAVAIRKMIRRPGEGAVVVDDERRLLGVLSGHDVVRWTRGLMGGTELAAAELAPRAESEAVAGLLSTTSLTIEESAPLTAALHIFQERPVESVAVIRDGRVTGILALNDILRFLGGSAETRAGSEPEKGMEATLA